MSQHSDRMEAALRKALNYIENTESELGIELECGIEARAVLDEAAKPAPGGPKTRDNDQPLRYCSYCRAWSSKPCGEGCHWEPTMPTPDFGRRNSPLLGRLYPPEPTVFEVPSCVDGKGE